MATRQDRGAHSFLFPRGGRPLDDMPPPAFGAGTGTACYGFRPIRGLDPVLVLEAS
jgi:hypothetical protein